MAMSNYLNHVWMNNILHPLAPSLNLSQAQAIRNQWSLPPHFNPIQSQQVPIDLPFFPPGEINNMNPIFIPWTTPFDSVALQNNSNMQPPPHAHPPPLQDPHAPPQIPQMIPQAQAPTNAPEPENIEKEEEEEVNLLGSGPVLEFSRINEVKVYLFRDQREKRCEASSGPNGGKPCNDLFSIIEEESSPSSPEGKMGQQPTMQTCLGLLISKFGTSREEHHKQNSNKVAKRNLVPDKRFSRKSAADNVVKQALAAWGDFSSESEEEPDARSSSMMAMQNEDDSLFALMARSDEDKENDNDELGDAEQSRDDLMVVVVDLKKTIENLSKEKNTLVEKIAATEQERDDMVVSFDDLREKMEEVTREHNLLKKQTNKWMDNTEGEEVVRKAQLELESELKKIETSVVAELEKNIQLQEDLKRVKNNLDKSLKWTRSSDVITSIYRGNGGNRQGIGFPKAKTSYNHHRKYVTVADNRLCTHCGQTGHYKDSCKVKIESLQKNRVFVEKRRTDEEPEDLGCLSAVNDNAELWHRSLGHSLKNIKEALKDADWITAVQEELRQLERNSMWNLVPRPADRTAMEARLPVYTYGSLRTKTSKSDIALLGVFAKKFQKKKPSRNLVPVTQNQNPKKSLVDFDGSLTEREQGRSISLECEAEVVVGFVEVLKDGEIVKRMEKSRLINDEVVYPADVIEKRKRETWQLRDRKGSVSEERGSIQKQKVEPLGLEGKDVDVSKSAVRQSVDSAIAGKKNGGTS
ncbi:PREDICTED: uncharacterized protein LOC109227649 [Nicotiana attenuata]|uniref:uncharacterized protein LOC109227649 n=1 Tax=Nicotiana attenuata TaxID=49451 RepID=UPI0009050783|nr:PREDICTED: uncharacterized protein LOC109227649 [Nicotiana attenuata]